MLRVQDVAFHPDISDPFQEPEIHNVITGPRVFYNNKELTAIRIIQPAPDILSRKVRGYSSQTG